MQEDLKEKFILLSKIAKEKKYAQEYLGLLARRGDIGSVRIGKRWYTTWEWFEEFLENSQKKKTESVSEAVKVAMPPVAEASADNPKKTVERKIVPMRGMGSMGEIRVIRKSASPERQSQSPRKISVEERNKNAVPYREVKLKKQTGMFSPDFSGASLSESLFPRFAFAAGFALLIFFAISGYLVYSGGLLSKGLVAGASDERNGNLLSIKSQSGFFVEQTGDKLKEAFSLSRAVIGAAKERESKKINP